MQSIPSYVNRAGVAQALGVVQTAIRYRYQRGQMPLPDVFVGSSPGWSAHRVELYRQRCLRYSGAPVVPPDWWDMEPTWYLSVTEVAHRLGGGWAALDLVRSWPSGGFLAPAVQLGARTFGWDDAAVIEFSADMRTV